MQSFAVVQEKTREVCKSTAVNKHRAVGDGRGLWFTFLFQFLSLWGQECLKGYPYWPTHFCLQSRLTCFLFHRSEVEASFAPSQVGQGSPSSCFRRGLEPSQLMRSR